MAKTRKPIPPTQRELSVQQHKSFDKEVGNPNYAVENGQTNRSLNLSFKGDNTKPFSIGIKILMNLYFITFKIL